jgi:hypothetical protein
MPVDPQRIRAMPRQFAPVNRRLVYDQHICNMSQPQLVLYLFLECVSDPQGLSYYSDTRICQYLHLRMEDLHAARTALIAGHYLLYQPPIYQLLDLPPAPTPPVACPRPRTSQRRATPRSEAVPIREVLDGLCRGMFHANP